MSENNKYVEQDKNINEDFFDACKKGNLTKVKHLLLVGDERGKADIRASMNIKPIIIDGHVIDHKTHEAHEYIPPKDHALIQAVIGGNQDVVEFLLTSKEVSENCDIDSNQYILATAIENEHYDLAKFLLLSSKLKVKANINYSGAPLMKSLDNENFDFATWMLTSPELEERANIGGKDSRWKKPCLLKDSKTTKTIIQPGQHNSDSALAWAVFNGDMERIKFLCEFSELQTFKALKNQKTRWGLDIKEILIRLIIQRMAEIKVVEDIVTYFIEDVGSKVPKFKEYLLLSESIEYVYSTKLRSRSFDEKFRTLNSEIPNTQKQNVKLKKEAILDDRGNEASGFVSYKIVGRSNNVIKETFSLREMFKWIEENSEKYSIVKY